MTAVEIIEEIKRLPQSEQNRVMEFVRSAGEGRPLTPDELGDLAKQMTEAKEPAEADRLQAEIVRGFYGPQVEDRLALYEKNPEAGDSWEKVQARLRSALTK